ncbi:MAG: 2-oxoacid:acceptor oxidoreductase family protein [Candidatus Undinarchaeales archaeon]|jgi:pyruvate ferredoxin oxidoreductase gamma subunit|nr:2-oxoacid:acceptor oxidoreductase family protein [Candidatus Undinarchaeales archaeon]
MIYEVRFHGRGGQGAVTAANLLAVAAGFEGKYSRAFPFFGVERRGAPVQAFCRISDKPFRSYQNVYTPNTVVVLDSSLIKDVDVASGLEKDGHVVVNCHECPKLKNGNTHYVDATKIALNHIKKPIVNTAMLGSFAKVTDVVKLDSLKKAVLEKFGESNVKALEECYNEVKS